ncbi:MAG: hypothetical protein D6718_10660 [Acidobacteria bacterium]|nr:MAG: hypothetical protein D6718_10660 [Acidobacteriota bacterium]
MRLPPPIFGLETEYAAAAPGREAGVVASALVRKVAASVPAIPADEGGIFLANGARVYVDAGGHPEYATPETADPWQLVRHARAGDRLLARACAELSGSPRGLRGAELYRGNADRAGGTVTWGSHENYAWWPVDIDPFPLLRAHLATRALYCGGGGFLLRAGGPRFVLSPRLITARPYRGSDLSYRVGRGEPIPRIHVTLGETLCSEQALWLRFATTALVLQLAQAGIPPHRPLPDPDEVAALRFELALAPIRDVASARHRQALEVQRTLLEMAERHSGAPWMPWWAPVACRRWRAVLGRIQRADPGLRATLDWALKLDLWCRIAADARGGGALLPEVNSAPADPGRAAVLDLVFGRLHPPGIFETLDAGGFLRHRMVRREAIDRALSEPPRRTRAWARGRAVRVVRAGTGQGVAGWSYVLDLASGAELELGEPWEAEGAWTASAASQPGAKSEPLDDLPF